MNTASAAAPVRQATPGTAIAPIFLSHGSPMTALEPGVAGPFWQALGARIDATVGRPRAILAISAHTLTREPVLLAAARHRTVHDFSGFPEPLYRLRFAWPAADIPVLPLGFPPDWSPARLFALGQALAPLASEGVLIYGSGSITHNLRLVFASRAGGMPPLDAAEMPESAAFRRWFADHATAGSAADWEALLDYRRQAPHAALMHPTDEHLLPFYVAAGAAGRVPALRLHDSLTYGCLGMDGYAFGAAAAGLQAPT